MDRRTALVQIDPEDSRKGTLLLTEPGVIAPLVALFEQVWDTAIPLGHECRAGGDGPSPRERALLSLVTQGHTDESAAAQLLISARTARRIMASLMERLGARSRFEAGVKAARLGWSQAAPGQGREDPAPFCPPFDSRRIHAVAHCRDNAASMSAICSGIK
ncbi:helix-turn-helix transcriptional regulator [Streptomyces sp. NPDC047072]|uniref:helix-turn-helix transcriptional regulator n=1 Tax=Streptomyces sp. NPDC047072 TaxID=3154809 RepID=UPI0033CFB21F